MTEHAPDITVPVTQPVARELIARADFERDAHGRWVDPNGRWTWATDEALTWALVAIAEQD
jgi:hypothetical protein